jgi:hypothetical protein
LKCTAFTIPGTFALLEGFMDDLMKMEVNLNAYDLFKSIPSIYDIPDRWLDFGYIFTGAIQLKTDINPFWNIVAF